MSGLWSRARALKLSSFVLVLSALVVPSFGGCGLQTSGNETREVETDDAGVSPKCENALHCDDANFCTIDSCGADGLCVHTEVDGDPPSQPNGDCKRITCTGGTPTEVADTADVDDGNACTDDACVAGAPTHTNADGDPCVLGAGSGVCKAGVCEVSCASASDTCDDSNPCTEDSCDLGAGVCVHDATKLEGTLVVDSDLGDCNEKRCVKGASVDLPDDSEVPNDSNDCTTDSCKAGSAIHDNIAIDTACGLAADMYCDGLGKCVQCNDPTQCGTDDDCNTFTCTSAVCGVDFTPAGTPVSAQQSGDCQEIQCNGSGGVMSANDNLDLPDDSNDCTNDVCTAGAPGHTNVGLGASCTGILGIGACDGGGICKLPQGQGCLTALECSTGFCIDNRCCDVACTSACKSCALAGKEGTCSDIAAFAEDNVPAGACAGASSCDGSGTCRKDNGQTCAAAADCVSGNCIDGRCCNTDCSGTCMACNVAGSLGICSFVPQLQKDSFPANACAGVNSCDGAGNCKQDNGQACAVVGDCSSGSCVDGYCCNTACSSACKACNVAGNLGTCSNLPVFTKDNNPANACAGSTSCDGAGNCKKDNGQTCAVAGDCTSNNCIDGYCCNTACGATCKACNVAGSLGTCTDIPAFTTDTFPANACGGNNSCDGAGGCKKNNGQTCAAAADCTSNNCVDGYCCNSTCNTLCKACNVAGFLGACTNIPALGKDNFPASSCAGINSCDGNGACLKDNGQTCVAAGDCSSSNCVDGYCCNSGCGTTCKACNIAGNLGTCSNVPQLAEDNNPLNACSGVTSCDGAGNCKKDNGQTCAVAGDCSSGNCVDGYCCDTSCTSACKACSVAGSLGVCSNLPALSNDSFPANACAGNNTCDGLGTCKKANGQTCAAASECASTNCVDGYCCNNACAGTCMACNVAGSLGACSNIAQLSPDTFPANTCVAPNSCDGMGGCKKNNGQTCVVAGDCSSGSCVDGYCCNTTCTGTCKACNVAGSLGTCSNIAQLTPDTFPANTCVAPNSCDGAGNCKKENGQTCAVAGECASGSCVDGYCCNSACTTACKACNVAGSLGTCSNLPALSNDAFPANACTGTNTCDGAGTCKKANGQTCAAASECASASCVDGYCCNNACAGTCMACNVAGSLGTCSNIAAFAPDSFPANTCVAPNSCDGLGSCKKNDGQECAVAGDCVSNNCVDGVCCNNACTTTCMACNVAGSLGTCSNVAQLSADTFPANACTGTSACDGAGNCKKVNGQTCALAAECASANCADGYCCNSTCTAACKACNVAGSLGTCSNLPPLASDNNPANACTGTSACDGAGTCKKANGQTCTLATECASASCVDGYCCDSACTTACMACNVVGSLGTCSNLGQFAQDNFPANACSGASSCDGAGACKKANGQVCGAASECTSGNCVDGVCCDTACAGSCMACSAATKGAGSDGVCDFVATGADPDGNCADQGAPSCGTDGFCDGAGGCRKYMAGTVCLASSCAAGTQTNAKTCDGMGTCQSNGTLACAPYICGPNACLTTCAMDNECVAGDYCTMGGQCAAQKALGDACVGANECSSGFCADGVCCNTACGSCLSCLGAVTGGVDGTCGNMPDGVDPDTDCADQGAASCGTDGVCDGAGACRKYAAGTVCLASSCAAGTQTNAKTCDGAGTCQSNGTTACTPYICGPTACLTSCSSDNDCINTDYCSNNLCVPKQANGGACTAAEQCSSGNCVDLFCCNTTCVGACFSCAAAESGGADGTCTAVPQFTADSLCLATEVCDGAGVCKLANGENCSDGSECASGTCTGAPQTTCQ